MGFQFNYIHYQKYTSSSFYLNLLKLVWTIFCECLMGTLKNVLIVNMFHKCEADCVK